MLERRTWRADHTNIMKQTKMISKSRLKKYCSPNK